VANLRMTPALRPRVEACIGRFEGNEKFISASWQ
jgi:hypothetical protein